MRKLRYGMVGGGAGAIGASHRVGAELNNLAVMTAGCFSRNREKSLKTAEEWNIPEDRIYDNYQEMAEKEAAREDGIDFVSIVTPNDTHYAIAKCFMEHGIHVMCDKPLCNSIVQAEELKKMAHEKDLLFGMTYTYTGYPMIRQAREMIKDGMIGDIVHVKVGHPEDWVYESVDEEPGQDLPWRFTPERVGYALCTGDVGTHAEQMLVQFTGLHIKRLAAIFDTFPRHLSMESNVTALLDLGDGITGDLWASQIALGKGCDAYCYVIGTKGALEWRHVTPGQLFYHQKGRPTQIYDTARPYLKEESLRLNYTYPGHHEGFYEAFGSIYQSFARTLQAKIEGGQAENYTFPTIDEGVEGVRFVKACLKSVQNGNAWVTLADLTD